MLDNALHNRRVGVDPGSGTDPDAQAAAVTRLRGAVYSVACHLVAEGVASEEDTDLAARTGLRWGRGPFEAMAADPDDATAAVRTLHERWGEAFPLPARFE
jgi:3-hydroxyacyl-CoA dehydrogenase